MDSPRRKPWVSVCPMDASPGRGERFVTNDASRFLADALGSLSPLPGLRTCRTTPAPRAAARGYHLSSLRDCRIVGRHAGMPLVPARREPPVIVCIRWTPAGKLPVAPVHKPRQGQRSVARGVSPWCRVHIPNKAPAGRQNITHDSMFDCPAQSVALTGLCAHWVPPPGAHAPGYKPPPRWGWRTQAPVGA